MKEKVSIVKLVFRRIAEIWRTIPVEEVGYPTENNYRIITEKVAGNSDSGRHAGGKRKRANSTLKPVNRKIEDLSLCFIK